MEGIAIRLEAITTSNKKLLVAMCLYDLLDLEIVTLWIPNATRFPEAVLGRISELLSLGEESSFGGCLAPVWTRRS